MGCGGREGGSGLLLNCRHNCVALELMSAVEGAVNKVWDRKGGSGGSNRHLACVASAFSLLSVHPHTPHFMPPSSLGPGHCRRSTSTNRLNVPRRMPPTMHLDEFRLTAPPASPLLIGPGHCCRLAPANRLHGCAALHPG